MDIRIFCIEHSLGGTIAKSLPGVLIATKPDTVNSQRVCANCVGCVGLCVGSKPIRKFSIAILLWLSHIYKSSCCVAAQLIFF